MRTKEEIDKLVKNRLGLRAIWSPIDYGTCWVKQRYIKNESRVETFEFGYCNIFLQLSETEQDMALEHERGHMVSFRTAATEHSIAIDLLKIGFSLGYLCPDNWAKIEAEADMYVARKYGIKESVEFMEKVTAHTPDMSQLRKKYLLQFWKENNG